MTIEILGLVIACVDTACWCICFFWMHRISKHQDGMLMELREQGKRIEKLSKIEHDLLREVHPNVNEIKEEVQKVRDHVTEGKSG